MVAVPAVLSAVPVLWKASPLPVYGSLFQRSSFDRTAVFMDSFSLLLCRFRKTGSRRRASGRGSHAKVYGRHVYRSYFARGSFVFPLRPDALRHRHLVRLARRLDCGNCFVRSLLPANHSYRAISITSAVLFTLYSSNFKKDFIL